MNFIGIDIGGSKIFICKADKNGEFVKNTTIPTEANKGHKQIIEKLTKQINTIKDKNTKAVGIAWAGFVDNKKGVISKSPNIAGFENFPIKKSLEKTVNLPIFVENDARLFALGEALASKKCYSPFLGIILGTGVGSGIIKNNQIFRGFDGFAGEIGHVFIDKNGKIEAEDLFSAHGLKNHLKKNKLSEKIEKSILKWQEKQKKEFIVIDKWLNYFSFWLSGLILTFNPEKIVFGGGIGTEIMPFFIKNLSEKTKNTLNKRGYFPTINLSCSKLKNAGAKGAVFFAIQEFKKKK